MLGAIALIAPARPATPRLALNDHNFAGSFFEVIHLENLREGRGGEEEDAEGKGGGRGDSPPPPRTRTK
jgi:hypothetical protein